MVKLANYRARRITTAVAVLFLVAGWIINNPDSYESVVSTNFQDDSKQSISEDTKYPTDSSVTLASTILSKLEIKGRAPKTGYKRTEFYDNWPSVDGCSLRQLIIRRELGESAILDGCDVIGGNFLEPYTGSSMTFYQKAELSKKIQIDHVVALSDAWQKGAQYKTKDERYAMATDPLNLLAVDSSANQQKSDGDAATWLPPNKSFRCQYVARQVSVKYKYGLWVTQAEHDAINRVLQSCPSEPAIGIE